MKLSSTQENKQHHIGFILEQVLGHRTHALTLQSMVNKDRSVQPSWGFIEAEVSGIAAKVPIYKSNWTVRAGLRARHILSELQRQQPLDALFFHTQVTAVLATNWVKRIPSIISLDATPRQYDTLGELYAHETSSQWLEHQKWRLNRNCFRHAHHLVTWSHWAKQGLIEEYEVPAEKITVLPPGINIAEWARPTARKLHDGPVKILFVGGDLKRKGGGLLLDAFRAVRTQISSHNDIAKNNQGIELHLVTHDDVSVEPGVFVYNDMQPNSRPLRALFHECDIFCLPTYGDTLAMVLAEAGAAGLPAITTSVGGTAEIVKDRETGFVLPVGDVTILTETLKKLIENPQLRLQQGAYARAVIRQRFNAEDNTEQLLALLKEAAATKVSPV